MTIQLKPCTTYDRFIETSDFNSCPQQEEIRKKISQLPGISFINLEPIPRRIQALELSQEAKELACKASNLKDNKPEKIELLERSFCLYKKFIKLNKDQIYDRRVQNIATDAAILGEDIIDLIKDEAKKRILRLQTRKIEIISGYSTALYTNSLNQIVGDALNIPQRHFAVTTEPLGTTNVKDCVFLVIRNKDRLCCAIPFEQHSCVMAA